MVRPVEGCGTLQTFMFGNKVNRNAAGVQYSAGPIEGISFRRKREVKGAEHVRFANLAKVGLPVVCFWTRVCVGYYIGRLN